MNRTDGETSSDRTESIAPRAWLIACAVAVPLAVVMELGGARLLASVLPSPRRDVYAHHFHQAARSPGDTDRPKVLILGSSMAIRGLDAKRMERELSAVREPRGVEVIHLGLWENREREKYLQTLDMIKQHPRVVVYTVSCNDMLEAELDDEEYFVSSSDTTPLYEAVGRVQPPDVLAKNLFYSSDLGRYRYLLGWRLRQLAKEWPEAAEMSAAEREEYFRLAVPPYAGDQAPPEEFRTWLESRRRIYASPEFTTQGPSRVFLEDAVTAWREAGSDVLLVNMPVYPSLMKSYRPGAYEDYLAFIEKIAERYRCHLLDAHRPGMFEEGDFYNSVHLNAGGQVKLTGQAIDAIRKLLEG